MKRTILLFFFLCLASLVASAQDVVYLKNGSIIKGSLIEVVPDQTLRLQTADGSIYVYQIEDVDRIAKEESEDESFLKKGFRGLVDMNVHLGTEGELVLFPSFTAGYQINKTVFIGGGVSPTYFFDEDEFFIPIYCSCRLDFKNAKNSFFFDARLGYSIAFTHIDDLSAYGYLGGGYRMNKWSFRAGLSYSLDLTYGIGIGYEF